MPTVYFISGMRTSTHAAKRDLGMFKNILAIIKKVLLFAA